MTAPIPQALAGTKINSLCEYNFDSLDVDFTRKSTAHQLVEGVWFSPANPTADITAVNGSLKLTWHSGQAVPHTDVSGRIAFGHGYFEASLKWDNVAGAWPAFWLLPIEGQQNPSISQAGEIDVMESIQKNAVYGNMHLWGPAGTALGDTSATDAFPAGFDVSQFHTYAVNWKPGPGSGSPGSVTWLVDGVAYGTQPVPPAADAQHYFPILTINAGLNWAQDAATLKQIAASQISMYVQWLRIWQ